MKQLTLSFLLALLPLMASADTVEIDGIWYNLISKVKTAEVTKKPYGYYSGAIVIPDKVIYNGSEYSVRSIGGSAFEFCSGLTSVTIPNGVTSIGDYAFRNCSSLTYLTIPNSVTAIGGAVFYDCCALTSVVFPNNISVIRASSFSGCNNLSTFTVPNSVTRIDKYAFSGCSALTKLYIGNGVKCIRDFAFSQCTELKDVYCMVESILPTDYFDDYERDLTRSGPDLDISDEIDDVYVSGGGLYTWTNTFEGSYIEYATLHVPESAIEAYKTTEPWSGFGKYLTLSGEESETPKCATPTISLVDGEIMFGCETEGVNYISEVTSSDIQKFYDDKLTLTYKYKVTVYAIKEGYENSDTATREIAITENGKAVLVGDVDGDGKVDVADHVELSKIIMGK